MLEKNPSAPQITLHTKLKNATSAIHRDVESGGSAARLMSDDLQRVEYLDYLSGLYGFVYPLEKIFRVHPEVVHFLPDLDARYKTSRLAQDIEALGGTLELDLAQISDLPALNSAAAVMGSLYVMEGSTLGGQLMRKKLLEREFITEANINYLSAYRENTGPMWRKFLDALAKFEAEEGDASLPSIPAAEATFRSLGAWMSSR